MHIRDYARAEGWFRRHAAAPSSVGSWKAFVARNKRAQEPRTMAQGPRMGLKPGGLVEPGVVNYGKKDKTFTRKKGIVPFESKGISLNENQLKLLKEKLTPQEFRKLKFGQARKGDAYDFGVFQRYRVTDAAVKSGSKKAGQKNRLFYKVTELLFPGKLTNASKILNNEKWTNKVIELTKAGKSSDDITEILKVYDNKITRNHTSSTINALVKQNKLSDTYTVLGSSGYTKGEMAGVNKIIEKEVAKGELGRADIGKKAEIADSYVEKWIRANKGDKFYETNYTYEKGLLKKGNLQQQKDLFKWVENTDNISAKAIAKKFGIKNSAARTLMADLVSTIYRARGNSKMGSLVVPYENEPLMKGVLNKIRQAPDFEDIYRKRIGVFVVDAYEGKPVLKKQAKKALGEYWKFSRHLKEVAPELALNLDHVVPYQFLEEVKQGEKAINMIRVKPIPGAVNKFKAHFDAARIDVARVLRTNPKNLDALAKFKILRDLENIMPIEFGGVSAKGHVFDFKQKPIGKSNLIDDAQDAVRLYNETGKFSQKVLKDKALQKKIIDAGVGTGKDLSIFRKIKPLSEQRTSKIMADLIELGCGSKKAQGGRIGFKSGIGPIRCIQKGREKLKNGINLKGVEKELADNITKQVIKATPKGFNWKTFAKGEAYFVAADVINNWTKGQSFWKGLGKGIEVGTFGLADFNTDERALLSKGKELVDQGVITQQEFDSMGAWLKYTQALKDRRATQEGLFSAAEDLKENEELGGKNILEGEAAGWNTLEAGVQSGADELSMADKNLDQIIEAYGSITGDDTMGYNTMSKVMDHLVGEEWSKTAGTVIDRGKRLNQGEGVPWGMAGHVIKDVGNLAASPWLGLQESNILEQAKMNLGLEETKPQERIMEHPVYGFEEDKLKHPEAWEDIALDMDYAINPTEQLYKGGGITSLKKKW